MNKLLMKYVPKKYHSSSCGIKTEDDKVYWTSTDNLEVV